MSSYKIIFQGFGTVNDPLARLLYRTGSFGKGEAAATLGGSGKNVWDKGKKQHSIEFLGASGIDLYIARGVQEVERIKEYYDFEPKGTVDELFSDNDAKLVIDATPSKETARAQKEQYYDTHALESVLFSGGASGLFEHHWCAVPGSFCDDTQPESRVADYLTKQYLVNNSCNATFLTTVIAGVSQAIDVSEVKMLRGKIDRRSRDVSEKHKPLGMGVTAPADRGETKYVSHLKKSVPGTKNWDVRISATTNPWEIAHVNDYTLTFKESYLRSFDDIVEAFHANPVCVLVDKDATLDMNYYDEMLKSQGIYEGRVTLPTVQLVPYSDTELRLRGFTPQEKIDTISKAVWALLKLGQVNTVHQGIEVVVNKGFDSYTWEGTPLTFKKLKPRLEALLSRHR
ncbi:hypothetical protein COT72_05370 [archaeon CG10_big_fil_rev_8_21_14_0_10_43_11]|nr:MAG: hypothetical protein COT72_05370 [archaeon CG10_big_fil_rev_8_21_14_0_10_43_11]